MFEELLRLLRDLATASRPLLLIVEDVHWADHTTLDLLTFMSRNVGAIPMLSMLTYRPQPVRRADAAIDLPARQWGQALRDFLFGHVSGAVTQNPLASRGPRTVTRAARPANDTAVCRARALDVPEARIRWIQDRTIEVVEALTSRGNVITEHWTGEGRRHLVVPGVPDGG